MTTKEDEGVGEQQGDMRRTLPGDFVTTVQPSDFTSNVLEVAEPKPVASTASKSNFAAQPDSYSMFQHLMEAQVLSVIVSLTGNCTQITFQIRAGFPDPTFRRGAPTSEDP